MVHGEMTQGMKTFLFLAEKVGGAFGWSGEAPDRIFETMKNVYKMDMVSSSLRLKSSSQDHGIKMAQDYGRELAKKLGL
jgi:flavorubredoxin